MNDRSGIAIFFVLMLGVVLWLTYGTYDRVLVWVVAGGLLLLMRAVFHPGAWPRALDTERSPRDARPLLYAVSLCAVLLAVSPRVVTACSPGAMRLLSGLFAIVAATALALARVETRARWSLAASIALGVCILLALVGRIVTVACTPAPHIDVFWTGTLGCDVLLQGNNPYAASYPDIYDGRFEHAPHFFYWPAYLFWVLPARCLAGDIRAASILADGVTAWAIHGMARSRRLPVKSSAALALLWLVQPVGLLVTEAAWVDPLLIASVAASLWCVEARRWVMLGVVLGFVSATKQYGALAALLIAIYVATKQRPFLGRVLAAWLITFLAWMVPFVAWNPRAFFDSTMDYYLGAHTRTDALSLVAWSRNELGREPAGWILALAYLAGLVAVAAWIARRSQSPADVAGGAAVLYGGIFLLGRLAFCNYYYFVAFLALALLVFSWHESEDSLLLRAASARS